MSQSNSTSSITAAAPAESTEYDPDTIVVARLTADPQLRHTASTGKSVTTLRVAEQHTNPQRFHDVVCWGRTAEVVCQYLKKGRSRPNPRVKSPRRSSACCGSYAAITSLASTVAGGAGSSAS